MIKMSSGLHVMYPLFLYPFYKTSFFSALFRYSNIILNENPYSGGRVVPCGQKDMTKVIVAFRNFAKAPKNGWEVGGVAVHMFLRRRSMQAALITSMPL
jgi:hypothetical protein